VANAMLANWSDTGWEEEELWVGIFPCHLSSLSTNYRNVYIYTLQIPPIKSY
jgi:hypothetical protein